MNGASPYFRYQPGQKVRYIPSWCHIGELNRFNGMPIIINDQSIHAHSGKKYRVLYVDKPEQDNFLHALIKVIEDKRIAWYDRQEEEIETYVVRMNDIIAEFPGGDGLKQGIIHRASRKTVGKSYQLVGVSPGGYDALLPPRLREGRVDTPFPSRTENWINQNSRGGIIIDSLATIKRSFSCHAGLLRETKDHCRMERTYQ